MKRTPPALVRPVGDPDGFGVGERVYGGWRYVCEGCSSCFVRRRWRHLGNKSNGWGLYATEAGVTAFCPVHAVEQTRARAGVAT